MNCHTEYTALLWAAVLFHNCGLPMKCILPNWTCRILCWRVTGHITKFVTNPFQHHSLCFLSDSSWSQCVLKGPAKTPIYLVAGKGSLSSHTGPVPLSEQGGWTGAGSPTESTWGEGRWAVETLRLGQASRTIQMDEGDHPNEWAIFL